MRQGKRKLSAQEISNLVDGHLIGDPSLVISDVSSIQSDRSETLTFCSEGKFEKFIPSAQRRIVLVNQDIRLDRPDHITYIVVPDVYIALSHILDHLKDDEHQPRTVSPTAIIDDSIELGHDVHIGHYVVIEAHAHIGSDSVIMDQVSIGKHVRIGKGTTIHKGVRVMDGVTIGSHVVIYPNTVIGGDGFGFVEEKGEYKKLPHIGSVVIEDNVEIGSNCTIDRGMVGDTIIREGAKLDNLIHIAHGVEVGHHVAIAAQTGISGSSVIGAYSQLGGQVGVIGHISIAPGSKIQAQSGVAGDIKEAGKKWYGYPSMGYYRYLRSFAIFKRLPELLSRLKSLEDRIDPNS